MGKYTIKQVQTYSRNLELTRPYTIAYQTFDTVENIFLEIETEGGVRGIGAGSPSDFVTGETMDSALQQLAGLDSFLIGKDLRMINALLREVDAQFPDNPAVRAAIDIALHDTLTRALGIRLVDWWGQVYQKLPTSVTIGIKSIEESQEEAREYAGMGFRVLKVKTGKSVAEDVAVLRKIREAVGREMKIRVDANQGYSVQDLLNFCRLTDKLDIELIEQPLSVNNWHSMKQVPEDIRKICMADENLKTTRDALQFAASPHLFGLYNIKLMKCGGLAAGRQIADVAHLGGIGLMWGCMDESIISITAALHAALASPATQYLDLDGSLDLAKDVVKGGFILANGYLQVGPDPGLGVIPFEY